MSMTQGEAVYQAVVGICGEQDGKYEPTKEQLSAIHESIFTMFKTGLTVHSKNPTDEQLKKYIPGLCNNWLRKDLRLNGGTQYIPKNPGSRSGSGDESIKAMKTLLGLTTDPDAKLAIQQEIDKRIAELKPAVTVDVSKLPESLRHLVK
jgi:hypothetical protein